MHAVIGIKTLVSTVDPVVAHELALASLGHYLGTLGTYCHIQSPQMRESLWKSRFQRRNPSHHWSKKCYKFEHIREDH